MTQALNAGRRSPGPDGQDRQKTKRYPSELTDEEPAQIAPGMPKHVRRARPRGVDFEKVINALRYLVRSGGGLRLPDFADGSKACAIVRLRIFASLAGRGESEAIKLFQASTSHQADDGVATARVEALVLVSVT